MTDIAKAKKMLDGPDGALLFLRLYVLMIVLAVGNGVGILVSGGPRFQVPGFAGPRNLVEPLPGAPWQVWGVIFVIFGVAMILTIGHHSAVHVLRAGGVVCFFFALGLGASVSSTPVLSVVGGLAYLVLGFVQIFIADFLTSTGWR